MLRMTWKVYACPKRMRSPGINGEGELRGQSANPGSPGKKWPLKRSVCVCVFVYVCDAIQAQASNHSHLSLISIIGKT